MSYQRHSKTKDIGSDESVFQQPRIVLLDENHWSYLQKRYHMTPRELQVAKLVCQGFSNDEIVKALKIRAGTLKTHLRNIYRKIRVKSKITLLLKFVDGASKFSAKSRITPPIPIVEIKKTAKKRAASAKMHKKGK